MIRIPHTPTHLRKVVFQPFAAVADFEEGVQKARDQRHLGKQTPPRGLRGRPAIGVDRRGRVIWLDLLGFYLELPIRFRQVMLIGLPRDGGVQDTIVPHGSGDKDLVPIQPSVFLVGEQIHRQFVELFDRGAHDIGNRSGDLRVL